MLIEITIDIIFVLIVIYFTLHWMNYLSAFIKAYNKRKEVNKMVANALKKYKHKHNEKTYREDKYKGYA